MKIYGTAKGGAISHKDFGVAFGGGGAAYGDQITIRQNSQNGFIQIHDMSGLSPQIDINTYFIIGPSPTPPAAPFQFWAVRTGTMGNAPTDLTNNGGSGDYARTEMVYRKPV